MLATLLVAAAFGQVAAANVRPQIGYVYPPGGRAGTTVEVRLGTYDWTPDMQVLVHDPRIKIEITGPAGEPILTPPPYWFGGKAGQAQPPLPREVPAKITIPAGFPPGQIKWQAANANGGTNVGTFIVGDANEVIEPETSASELAIPSLPVAINGRLSRITEIDTYRFTVADAGLVVCRLEDQLGQPFHGLVSIRDADGKLVADKADTTGNGATVLFTAQAGATYTASVHDVEFAGDRGHVYRLSIGRGPLVICTLPLVVKPGFSGPIEFVGWGVATGQQKLESAAHPVAVPADAKGETFTCSFNTPAGTAKALIALGDANDSLEPASADIAARQLTLPGSIAGALDNVDASLQMPVDRYRFTAKKGDALRLSIDAARFGSPVDPSVVILAADGKEVARNDDVPGGTDAAIDFKAAADGVYDVLVSDVSGATPTRASTYRLVTENAASAADFSLQVPEKLDVGLGGTADLALKAVRRGAWKEPISLRIEGLPAGVTVPADMVVPEAKKDPKLTLTASDQAAATASLATIIATATIGDRKIEHRAGPLLVTTTLKTRCKVKSAVQDGGRIVNRGTTYPADVIIERLEGYNGPVTLQMGAVQQRQRRGIRGTTLTVPAGVDTVQYPVFMPEWLETSLTARINVIGVVQVPDAKGNIRHVTGVMDGFIVMSLEGGLLKLSHETQERVVKTGTEIEIPLRVSRSVKLPEAATVELVATGAAEGLITAKPIAVPATESTAVVKLQLANDPRLVGVKEVTIRATALQNGKWPVVSETTIPLVIEAGPAVASK